MGREQERTVEAPERPTPRNAFERLRSWRLGTDIALGHAADKVRRKEHARAVASSSPKGEAHEGNAAMAASEHIVFIRPQAKARSEGMSSRSVAVAVETRGDRYSEYTGLRGFRERAEEVTAILSSSIEKADRASEERK